MPIMFPLHAHATHTQCIEWASNTYHVPSDLVRAVMRAENGCGRLGARNRDGTRDMGCMQINPQHMPWLHKYGITQDILIHDDCVNIQIGTYLVSEDLHNNPDFWRGVGAYNSGNWTPSKESSNAAYRSAVWHHLVDIWTGH